jgi:exonuclease SbcC
MRPRELALRGFRSYAGDTTFDFGDRTLVGIVGPIGSGKSSILDAVAFALYGKTPRIERDTKSLINQRADQAHVSLTFDVDGVRWRATRVLRRRGASAHTLYRVDGEDEVPVADKEKEVTRQVETILGMDFEAFRRSVLLAQNQFAGFLEAKPVERNQVLKGVFGFERLDAMRDVVKGRLDRLGGRLQALAERRASAEADRALLAGRQAALTAAEERAAALAALRVSVSQAKEVVDEAERTVTRLAGDAKALDALADSVPTREDTEGLFAEAEAAADARVAAEAAAAAARAEEERTAELLDAALEAVGGRAALDRAGDLVASVRAAADRLAAEQDRERRAAEARVAADEAVLAATDALAGAESAVAAVRAEVEAAESAEEAARAALHAAHQADRVSLLRSDLVVGRPCPVCEQTVATLPGRVDAPEIESADRRLGEAIAATAAARERDAAALAALAERKAGLAAAGERSTAAGEGAAAASAAVAAAGEALAVQQAAAAEILGEGDPAERLAEVRAGVAAAEVVARAARGASEAARAALDGARARSDAAAARLTRLRNDLAALGGRLGVDVAAGDTPAEVQDGLRLLRDEWVRRRTEITAAAEQAARALDAARAARIELLQGAGLEASDDIVEVATEAAREASGIAAEVRAATQRLAELDALGAEEREMVATSARLERLHTDLRPSAFLEFVLDERRRALADLAGEHFEVLTAGRYRFGDDADFGVVDLNAADLVRAPASLSGGETFLASLALALALAEIVAREGGRLDAFFLDEGFGSLDPEHLDLAMDGIERLVAGGVGRLVVVVSHVAAMRDRIEDLIVLDRDDLGNTRVVAGASPP